MTTFPTAPHSDDSDGRRALVRTLTNQMNKDERHFRQMMASQEDIDRKQTEYAQRSDQGHHSICSMLDEVSGQISEGHEVMATKSDVDALRQQLNRIEEHLIQYDHLVIPKEESNA